MPEAMRFRLEWWRPMAGDMGEWAGRWSEFDASAALLDLAARVLGEGVAEDLVLVSVYCLEGRLISRSALGASELTSWAAAPDGPPPEGRDLALLPPLGREEIEISALARCRQALAPASDAGLLDGDLLDALLAIAQEAFHGVGPAIDRARAVRGGYPPALLT